MNPIAIILTVAAYFAVMFLVSWIAARGARGAGDFFNGGRKAPWWVVAIAMIGAPMSGVTYVSVPGMESPGKPRRGLLEVAVVEALERLAVARLVLRHLVDGVVDRVVAELLRALGDRELAGGRAALGLHAAAEVLLGGVRHDVDRLAEELGELSGVLGLLERDALVRLCLYASATSG